MDKGDPGLGDAPLSVQPSKRQNSAAGLWFFFRTRVGLEAGLAGGDPQRRDQGWVWCEEGRGDTRCQGRSRLTAAQCPAGASNRWKEAPRTPVMEGASGDRLPLGICLGRGQP